MERVDIRFTDDPSVCADRAGDFMRADPFSTSVIGVHTSGVIAGKRPRGLEDLWAVVEAGGVVVGLAMHTPPHNIFLSRMMPEAASRLAGAVNELGRAVPGVTGEATAVEVFAARWAELTGASTSVAVAMRMYRLGQLQAPAGVPGSARLAGTEDAGVVRAWFAAFHAETVRGAEPDTARLADRRLGAGEVMLWTDRHEAVSMAGCSAPANGVARVGPVYTPPGHRRHGYGAAVTASATGQALEKGAAHVVLYTDLANPTSNSVYRSIGYLADHDASERHFARA